MLHKKNSMLSLGNLTGAIQIANTYFYCMKQQRLLDFKLVGHEINLFKIFSYLRNRKLCRLKSF